MNTAAHFACLLIHRNRTNAALALLEKHFQMQHQQGVSPYNMPLIWDLAGETPCANTPERPSTALAYWYVFHAISGIMLNIPKKILRVTPHLPAGMHSMEMPVFTSVCLGWLKFQENTPDGALQLITVSFDSPVALDVIELNVPAGLNALHIWCEDASGFLDVVYALQSGEEKQRLLIRTKNTVSIHGTLTIRVTVPPPGPPKVSQVP